MNQHKPASTQQKTDAASQTDNPVTQAATLAKKPVRDTEDIQRLVAAIDQIMDALDDLLAEETALIGAGKLKQAQELIEAKNQLSIQYMLLQKAIVANASLVKQLSPLSSEHLQRRHLMFQNTLRTNLAVVATAKEVSSELVETINAEVQKGARANTYGRAGQMPQQPKQSRGIAVDQSS